MAKKNELRNPRKMYTNLFDVFGTQKNLSIVPRRQSWWAKLMHRRLLDNGEAKAAAAQVDAQVETAQMIRDAQIEAARERLAVMVADIGRQCEEEMLSHKLDALQRVFEDCQQRLDTIEAMNLREDKKLEYICLIEKNWALSVERLEHR